MQYKGYVGSVEFSESDAKYFGRVRGIRALVSYEGNDIDELAQDFHDAVDDYLTVCRNDETIEIAVDADLYEELSKILGEQGLTPEEAAVMLFEYVAATGTVPPLLMEAYLEEQEWAAAESKRKPFVFHSALSEEEIKANFEGVDVGEGILAALNEVLTSAKKSEDEYDLAVAEQAYAEYIRSGKKSSPVSDFWKELGL